MPKFLGFPDPEPFLLLVEQILLEKTQDREGALAITCNEADTAADVRERVIQGLISRYWWLQRYWQDKGAPSERFVASCPVHNLEVYNFGSPLGMGHLNELRSVIKEFALIKEGYLLRSVDYIVCDDVDYRNPQSGDSTNGHCGAGERLITVFPSALVDRSHRVSATSNFEGTLIHEFSHLIGTELQNRWSEAFEWRPAVTAETMPGGMLQTHVCQQPERCITEYATLTPQDDLCESMVAAIKSPELLDPERLEFLQSCLLDTRTGQTDVKVEQQDTVDFPPCPSTVRYLLKLNPVRVRRQA